ncbi:MAG: hypothetical protein KF819_17315 [Labilithrix sp.]|nr:hypothetical protein [Labilithrix sp.]
MRRWVLAPCLVAVLVAGGGEARAQNEGGTAAAESLFQEARKLIDAKRYGEACPKLVASHKLAPAVGTLLNLADCYEKDNKLASAWARFHEAIALAQRLGRPDREKTARDRADKLEPRLIKLTINTREPQAEVKLDGNTLDPAALGSPVPIDSGRHVIEASAKGKKTFSTTLEASEKNKSPSVDIPQLENDPDATKVAPTTVASPRETVDEPPSSGSTQRILGIVAIGAGAVGVGLGAFFGLRTSSLWSDAKARCSEAPVRSAGDVGGLECDQTGVVLATDAQNAGTASTIAFIAGGALLAGGIALYFTAPTGNTSSSTAMRVGVGPGSVVVGGRW